MWELVNDRPGMFVPERGGRGSGAIPICFHCGARFEKRRDLLAHEKESHANQFACGSCGKHFAGSCQPRQHAVSCQHSLPNVFKLPNEQ